MVKTILLLLYIYNGQVKLDQIPMQSVEQCQEQAQILIDAQEKDPRFDGGLYAQCIQLPVTEAKK